MKAKSRYVLSNIKLIGTIVPVVLVLILIYFILVRREVMILSQEKLTLESQYYAEEISTWAKSIINELTIYKTLITQLGPDREETYSLMRSSAGTHEAYPYGLYMGDDQGNYFMSSGWVPDDDFVVTERNWYIEGLTHDQFAFGEPYVDAMTGKTCVSVTCRLNTASAATVLSADVYLDYASHLVSAATSDKIDHAFFVTAERIIVADSNPDMVGLSLNDQNELLLYQNISRLLDAGKTGQSSVLGNESVYLVDINVIPDTDWYFVTCMSRNEVLSSLWQIELPMFLFAMVACVVLLVLTSLVSQEMNKSHNQAKLDPLTKLLSREGFEELVKLSLEDRSGQGVLIILDIDNFKLINDRLGHSVGDQALKEFAAVLENYFNRNKDIVARLAGDEFGVFVGRDITAAETESMLNKFLSVVHQTFDQKSPQLELSVSIGVGAAAHCETYEALCQTADKALYEAKENGKDRFQIR